MLKTLTIYLIPWHRKTQKVILQLGSKLHQKRHRSLYRIALVLLGDKTLLALYLVLVLLYYLCAKNQLDLDSYWQRTLSLFFKTLFAKKQTRTMVCALFEVLFKNEIFGF